MAERSLFHEEGLIELLYTLKSRAPLILLVMFSVGLGAFFYVERLPSEYEARTILSISPDPNSTTSNADTIRLLTSKYVAFAGAPATITKVAAEVGQDVEDLQAALDVTSEADTGNIVIAVELTDPRKAASAANELASETELFAERDALVDAEIVAPALLPRTPSNPPRRLLEAAALMAGFILAVALVFLLERGRPTLRTWREIESQAGYPVIARVPASKRIKSDPTKALADPQIGAVFRTLRTYLQWRPRSESSGESPKTWLATSSALPGQTASALPSLKGAVGGTTSILVTSPEAGNGKTSVAALFAESLARIGAKVLLVDADLHRPALARMIGDDVGRGFAAVLREQSPASSEIRAGWTEGLWLLPTVGDHESGDLLATRLDPFIQATNGKVDAIIFDSPMILGTDDALTLATHVDSVLLVIPARSTARRVHEAVLALQSVNANVLGVVANKLREKLNPYYTYSEGA